MQTVDLPAYFSKRKQACKSCRQRKKKCDAERPKCSLCTKWSRQCEYVATTEAPLSRRHVAEYDVVDGVRPTQLTVPPSFSPELAGPLDYMQFPGINFDVSMSEDPEAQLVYRTLGLNSQTNEICALQDVVADYELPPHQLLLELVELFFENLYYIFPCFHHKNFLAEVQTGITQGESPLLLYAICCLTARYHPNASVRKRQKDWYEQAKFSYDLTRRDPYPGLRTIQAALLLIYHASTAGDFSSSWLFLGKVWKQAVTLGMNCMDASNPMNSEDMSSNKENAFGHQEIAPRSAAQKEEYRRTLWLLFIMDRNHVWPTGWPNTIQETSFKVDVPISDILFQSMPSDTEVSPYKSVPFTRNLNRFATSASWVTDPLNMFHYICIAHVLLGRVAELVHSLHDAPDTPEYAEECRELDSCIVKFRLSLPRQATSLLEASPGHQNHIVWLQVMLNTSAILLHYRCAHDVPVANVSSQFMLAVTAARNTAQVIKDASRISIDLLISAHIGSALYVAAAVLVIQWRTTEDPSLKDEIDLFILVFERMNDVFVFFGLKFKLALEHDIRRSAESVQDLKSRGFKGLLADCRKWTHVKEQMHQRGLQIEIT